MNTSLSIGRLNSSSIACGAERVAKLRDDQNFGRCEYRAGGWRQQQYTGAKVPRRRITSPSSCKAMD